MTDTPPATPAAHGGPAGSALLRVEAADFRVDEIMTVVPDGEGEHLWLDIEKTHWNTEDVALWLAKQAGVHRLAVGYSGLKDRRAVTRQWFSLHLPGKPDPDFEAAEGLVIHRAVRHRRKLNRGTHRGNAFQLRLRQVEADRDRLAATLAAVAGQGVPNYFGEQRFGRDGANWSRGRAWLLGGEAPRKRTLRNFWLSAVRSGLFNAVLAERVRDGVWDRLLEGDLLRPDGSRGLFAADEDTTSAARVAAGEVHPTAPMPGRAGMASSAACQRLEQRVLAPHDGLIAALAELGLDAERRATRLPVTGLEWGWAGDTLELALRLPTGAFATSVLAELLTTTTP
ncbi:tRNA pseudouridine(13) synthase TruD [Alloalcanivorax sp. C16-1]|uniref:tRNA pseudouridine(13) synthase TruD n=1 Tax=Alloalcanivorax sp. C16-1 TaxID=3390051 RepID=UPI00397073B0